VIVMVFEVKHTLGAGKQLDCVAQVMCELHSASYMNGLHGIEPFRVYGILSDCTTFKFLGYDGSTFYRDDPIALSRENPRGVSLDLYLDAMGWVSTRIFPFSSKAIYQLSMPSGKSLSTGGNREIHHHQALMDLSLEDRYNFTP